MSLPSFLGLIQDEIKAVDQLIRARLQSDVVLINQLGSHIVASGGKRLRPALVILAARASGYGGGAHVLLAAVIEFIHTATLLHDDVVDGSDLRRGMQTANALWANEASVLTGDFLYSRAFQMMVEAGQMRVMRVLADTTNAIAEGEVLQLMNCHDPDITEERYLQVIERKTARLFEAAARLGAILAGSPPTTEEALARYGLHLGNAFQLIDDALDYSSSSETLGKNIGDDLAEGKPTLPLIHAMRRGSAEQAQLIRAAIQQGGLDCIEDVRQAIESTGAITYTAALARQEADKALAAIADLADIPDSAYKDALVRLAEFSVSRSF
jgi:octaprenyl-diphosphate synthase